MRESWSELWTRFDALPNSERYPSSSSDESEILRRAYAIGSILLSQSECWIVQVGESALGWPEEAERFRDVFGLTHHGDCVEDDVRLPIFAARTHFLIGKFDALLLDVARDRALRTLWMSEATGSVFAPYDGGFDTFVDSEHAAGALRSQFVEWLPDRPDGL